VLVGSNVGTCITPILTAIGLRAGNLSVLFAPIGILALLLKSKFPKIAAPAAAFCLMMWGMHIMSSDTAPLTALAQNTLWCALLGHPLGAWGIGLISTALLQSSSLTMALLQIYTLSSPLAMDIALPFILGQNIGTTATALLATFKKLPVRDWLI